jgi:hypothetical protein
MARGLMPFIEAVLERFPKWVLSFPQWKKENPPSSDLRRWREGLRLDGVEVLYVFGLGDGAAYRLLQEWLLLHPERRVVFLEEEGSVFAFHLAHKASFFLDRQVDFEWLPRGKAASVLFEELAERYPSSRIQVTSLPTYPKARFQRHRSALLKNTFLSSALFLDRIQGHHLFHHFLANLKVIEGAFYANGLRGALQNVPAIVCGAGPSLKEALSFLSQLKGEAVVIAGGSAVTALSRHSIRPHFGVAIDPNPEEVERFQKSQLRDIPLLVSTRLHPEVLTVWRGPVGYLRGGIGGAPELWLEEELGLQDLPLGQDLPPESISVTSIGVEFARLLGCSTILLAGMDLAYTGGERYASGVSDEKRFAEMEKLPADRVLHRKDKRGRRVETALRWIIEARGLSKLAQKHPDIRWINTTPGGLRIDGFEELSLEQWAIEQARERFDIQGILQREIALHPLQKKGAPSLSSLGDALVQSLQRVILHLEILASERKGSSALAEWELKEELATSLLFYDADKVIRQALYRSVDRGDKDKWRLFLEMARRNIY